MPTTPKPDANPNLSHGERLRKSFALSSRERRSWTRRVLDAGEAIDKAEDALTKVLYEAWEAGMSYATLGALISVHGTTIKERLDAYTGRTEEDH